MPLQLLKQIHILKYSRVNVSSMNKCMLNKISKSPYRVYFMRTHHYTNRNANAKKNRNKNEFQTEIWHTNGSFHFFIVCYTCYRIIIFQPDKNNFLLATLIVDIVEFWMKTVKICSTDWIMIIVLSRNLWLKLIKSIESISCSHFSIFFVHTIRRQ